MAKLRQENAFPPGVYRGIPFTPERIKRHIEGTNKAIAAGVAIPLLTKHAKLNASDEETNQFSAVEGRGWVSRLFQNPKTGALGWEADNVPEDFARAVQEGTVKLTSPEFRESYASEKAGVYSGPIVRHMAFTPLPGNPHQSPIETIALSEEGVFQFSELDLDNDPQVEGDLGDLDNEDEDEDDVKSKKKKDKDGEEGPVDDAEVKETVDKPEDSQHAEKQPNIYHALHDRDVPAFESLIKKHGGTKIGHQDPDSGEHNSNTYHVPKSKHAALKRDASSLGFHHGDHFGDFDSSQHAEMITMSDGKTKLAANNSAILGGRGWKKVGGPTGGHTGHQHADFPGHHILSHKDGNWTHTGPYGVIGAGKGSQSLHDHLTKHHNRDSQHAEDEFGKKKPEATDDPAQTTDPTDIVTPESPPPVDPMANNPDAPPKATDKSQLAAIIAGLGQLGPVVPSDWDPYNDVELAMKTLMTGINTCIRAKNDAEAADAKEPDEESPEPQEVSPQFSEDELAALPPKAREIIINAEKQRIADAKAKQFAEEQAAIARNALAVNTAKATIESKRLPPSLKRPLVAAFEEGTVQFSEGVEQPMFTATQVAAMFDAALPPNMRFAEADVKTADEPHGQFRENGPINNPGGTHHVSDDRAEELVSNNPMFKNAPKPAPFKSMNEWVGGNPTPNNVMRK